VDGEEAHVGKKCLQLCEDAVEGRADTACDGEDEPLGLGAHGLGEGGV
jgi:hypothetical protein